jgi:hypothetical protein
MNPGSQSLLAQSRATLKTVVIRFDYAALSFLRESAARDVWQTFKPPVRHVTAVCHNY